MKTHRLKIADHFWLPLVSGEKNFEVRFNDRDYLVGDVIEVVPVSYQSAAPAVRRITFILNGGAWGIEVGYVVMGLEKLT